MRVLGGGLKKRWRSRDYCDWDCDWNFYLGDDDG